VKDVELLKLVREFRMGIIESRHHSKRMCYMVCAPLAGFLEFCGVKCELVESEIIIDSEFFNHFWIRLSDGRVLDPTIDQFNRRGIRRPPVYLGKPIKLYHTPLAAESVKNVETPKTNTQEF